MYYLSIHVSLFMIYYYYHFNALFPSNLIQHMLH